MLFFAYELLFFNYFYVCCIIEVFIYVYTRSFYVFWIFRCWNNFLFYVVFCNFCYFKLYSKSLFIYFLYFLESLNKQNIKNRPHMIKPLKPVQQTDKPWTCKSTKLIKLMVEIGSLFWTHSLGRMGFLALNPILTDRCPALLTYLKDSLRFAHIG